MTASTRSTIRRIEILIEYEFDGEPERGVQSLNVQFVDAETIAIIQSSGILDDFRLLFGDRAIVKSLPNGQYQYIGLIEPSPMRHFNVDGGCKGSFPSEYLQRIGGDWESKLMSWTVHIPTTEFDAFCARHALSFQASDEIFSGISCIRY